MRKKIPRPYLNQSVIEGMRRTVLFCLSEIALAIMSIRDLTTALR
ncbi:hypothetical protein N9C39_08375 [Luminiphilus sp.]|nr:hypothetical protein [Luminiphilus sp.]